MLKKGRLLAGHWDDGKVLRPQATQHACASPGPASPKASLNQVGCWLTSVTDEPGGNACRWAGQGQSSRHQLPGRQGPSATAWMSECPSQIGWAYSAARRQVSAAPLPALYLRPAVQRKQKLCHRLSAAPAADQYVLCVAVHEVVLLR